jgi:hypothetical protein
MSNVRRFQPPWFRGGIGRHDQTHQSKIEAIKPISRTLTLSKRNMDRSRRTRARRQWPTAIGWLKLRKSFANSNRSLSASKRRIGSLSNDERGRLFHRGDGARRIAANKRRANPMAVYDQPSVYRVSIMLLVAMIVSA